MPKDTCKVSLMMVITLTIMIIDAPNINYYITIIEDRFIPASDNR